MRNNIKRIIKFETFEKFFLFFFIYIKMWNLRKLLIKISLYWMAYIIDYLKKNILSTIFEILFNDLVMKEIY